MKQLLSLLLSGLVLFLAGCGAARTEGTAVEFYYAITNDVESGPAIQSETEWLDHVTVNDVMRRLLKGPENTAAFSRTFPEGTTLQSWTMQEGNLRLDLSEAFGRLSGIAMTKAEYCIVLTLSQLDEVDTITITAGGQPLPGSASNALSAEDVILKGETEDPFTVSSQLYFPLKDQSGLGVEYREFEAAGLDVTAQANAVLQQLCRGPNAEDLISIFNVAGKIEAVQVRNEICVVELDQATMEGICRSDETFSLNLYAIVDSLAELDGITGVIFRLDGQPIKGWLAEYTPVYEF